MINGIKQTVKIFLAALVFLLPIGTMAQTLSTLEQQLAEQQKQIAELEKKQAEYEASIAKKRGEARTLANQISIIDDQLQRTSLSIQTTETQIQATELEIKRVQDSIEEQQKKIDEGRDQLAATVRALSKSRDNSLLKILLTHDSFSDFYDEIQAYNRVQVAASDLVNEVETSKSLLIKQQGDLENNRVVLTSQNQELNSKKFKLSDQQDLQEAVLNQTKLDEQKYKELLAELEKEQLEANAAVKRLEAEVRQRLLAEGKISNVVATLGWPVPKNRVTTYFHDPDYPFNHLFKHNAIDIRAAQGTMIKAPADGYVATVRTGDPRRYWYLVLVHDGGISTVYGHVSRVYVSDGEKVSAGQTVALTGAMPGTPGAGPFTTGPHLHFEVHKDGSPVNPLDYLP
jgi:murein DD-endopeptidase MepM/ murein hydrolase activator NlpD